MDVYENFKKLNIELRSVTEPKGAYELCKRVGNLIFVSGQGPIIGENVIYTGKLGKEVSIETGQEAAKLCVLNSLNILQHELKDLNNIKNIVKLLGFVSSHSEFNEQTKVIDGASQLLIDIFGSKGRHARSAIGVNELPMNISTEVELIVEVYE